MFLIFYNCCITPSRYWKPSRKNNKYWTHIGLYYWKGIRFPAGIKNWKRFERNNKTIDLNILFVPHNEKTINLAYKSKYNRKRENQIVLLMITNGEKRILLL